MARENIFQRALKRTNDSCFGRAMHLFDRAAIGDEVWEELEELLIAADVGVNTAGKIIDRVKQRVAEESIAQSLLVRNALKEEMVAVLSIPLPVSTDQARPKITLVVGVNGSGKTTSIAKLAYKLKGEGKNVLLAAADTFRAAAIDQLQRQGERVGV
ncbi:signal recognition particle receptor subunit alpha, partial [Chloroflexota bacterium]